MEWCPISGNAVADASSNHREPKGLNCPREIINVYNFESAKPCPYAPIPCVQPSRYLSLRASRSDSSRHRMSSSRTVAHHQDQRPSSPRSLAPACLGQAELTWSLDVPDDRSGLVVHELDADLRDTTARAYLESALPFPPVLRSSLRSFGVPYRCGQERG